MSLPHALTKTASVPDAEEVRSPGWAPPRIRIAVPSFGLAYRRVERAAPKGPRAQDFKSLFDAGMRPADALHLRLTERERREAARSVRIRNALYGRPDLA
ncbi:MAG: hypothetical protein AAFR35_14495 [Pseudomonadota bacterium]